MSVIATEDKKLSDLIQDELWPDLGYARNVYVYNGTAKTFNIGDLVKADGTVPANAGEIKGIVIGKVSAPATTNTNVLVLDVSGPTAAVVKSGGLILGALTLANVRTQLATVGVKVLTTV